MSTPSVRAIAPASFVPSSGPSSIAPARTRMPHGASPPGMRTTSSSVPMPSTGAGPSVPGPRVDRLRGLEGEREQAATLAGAPRRGDPGPLDVGRPRDEATRPALPDPDQRGAGREPDPPAGLVEGGVEPGRQRGDLGQIGEQVEPGRRLGQRLARRRRAVAAAAARGRSRLDGAGGRSGLRRREEPLEVVQPVAAVTALVDPVVAEPAGLAPCPDRVRMHAKDTRRLRDRQRRVARTRGPGDRWRHGGFGRHCRSGRMVPDFTTIANRTMFS